MSLWVLDQSKKYADNAVETYENMQGYIYGLTLSNNSVDAVNDIDIAIGRARNDDNDYTMVLASAITKRSDAAWAVGTGNGGMDTGTKPNSGTLHVWLIRRSDTGVVDALFSISATAPTMPTNYDQKRRIGSVLTGETTAPILEFIQIEDLFSHPSAITDLNISASIPTSATLVTISVPSGITVDAVVSASMRLSGTSFAALLLGGYNYTNFAVMSLEGATNSRGTNTLHVVPIGGQVYYHVTNADRVANVTIITAGWIDTRGRLG